MTSLTNQEWKQAAAQFVSELQSVTATKESLSACTKLGLSPETADNIIRWNACNKTFHRKEWGLSGKGEFTIPAGIVLLNLRNVIHDSSDGELVGIVVCCPKDNNRYDTILVEGSANVPFLLGNERKYIDKKKAKPTASQVIVCGTPLSAVKMYQNSLKKKKSICYVSYTKEDNKDDAETKELSALPAPDFTDLINVFTK